MKQYTGDEIKKANQANFNNSIWNNTPNANLINSNSINIIQAEKTLDAKLQKGLISNELYQDAYHELSILKGGDPTHGGKLHAKFITDKNGKKTIVYVAPITDLADHHNIKEGDKFKTKDGKVHTVVANKGYKEFNGKGAGHIVSLQDENGRKHDKFIHNLESHEDEVATKLDSDIKSTTTIDLIKEAAAKNTKSVEVTFTPTPGNPSKKEVFNVITEGDSILDLIKNPKDVVSIKFKEEGKYSVSKKDGKISVRHIPGKDLGEATQSSFLNSINTHGHLVKEGETLKPQEFIDKIKANTKDTPKREEHLKATHAAFGLPYKEEPKKEEKPEYKNKSIHIEKELNPYKSDGSYIHYVYYKGTAAGEEKMPYATAEKAEQAAKELDERFAALGLGGDDEESEELNPKTSPYHKILYENKKTIYNGVMKIGNQYFGKTSSGFVHSPFDDTSFKILDPNKSINEEGEKVKPDETIVTDAEYLGTIFNAKTGKVEELPGYKGAEGAQMTTNFVNDFYSKNTDKYLISYDAGNDDISLIIPTKKK
jgi:hypothetical protein